MEREWQNKTIDGCMCGVFLEASDHAPGRTEKEKQRFTTRTPKDTRPSAPADSSIAELQAQLAKKKWASTVGSDACAYTVQSGAAQIDANSHHRVVLSCCCWGV